MPTGVERRSDRNRRPPSTMRPSAPAPVKMYTARLPDSVIAGLVADEAAGGAVAPGTPPGVAFGVLEGPIVAPGTALAEARFEPFTVNEIWPAMGCPSALVTR